MKHILHTFFLVCFLFCVQITSFSQINFFTDDTDTTVNTFYARSHATSFLITGSLPAKSFGVSCFFHNNHDFLSYYVHASTNGIQNTTITGTEVQGDTKTEVRVPFSQVTIHIGIAHALTRNLFVYGHTGFVYTYSSFANEQKPEFIFTDIPQGMNALLGGGILYVSDNNMSFTAGMQSYMRSIMFGIGYSL